jgi:hypothetical protein
VHLDKCCPDDVHQSFEVSENPIRQDLAEYCSWKDWGRLPGSGPKKFDGYYSDGRVTRISPERVAQPSRCGPGG